MVNHLEQKDGRQGRESHVFLSIFQLCLNISIRPFFPPLYIETEFFQFDDMYGKFMDISTTLKTVIPPTHTYSRHIRYKNPFPILFFLFFKRIFSRQFHVFATKSILSVTKSSRPMPALRPVKNLKMIALTIGLDRNTHMG